MSPGSRSFIKRSGTTRHHFMVYMEDGNLCEVQLEVEWDKGAPPPGKEIGRWII